MIEVFCVVKQRSKSLPSHCHKPVSFVIMCVLSSWYGSVFVHLTTGMQAAGSVIMRLLPFLTKVMGD